MAAEDGLRKLERFYELVKLNLKIYLGTGMSLLNKSEAGQTLEQSATYTGTFTSRRVEALVAEPIVYGSGTIGAETGEYVGLRREGCIFFVVDRNDRVLWTTESEDWIWTHLFVDCPWSEEDW